MITRFGKIQEKPYKGVKKANALCWFENISLR